MISIGKTLFQCTKLFIKRRFSIATVLHAQHVKEEKETHFGFETVKESEKAGKGSVFLQNSKLMFIIVII